VPTRRLRTSDSSFNALRACRAQFHPFQDTKGNASHIQMSLMCKTLKLSEFQIEFLIANRPKDDDSILIKSSVCRISPCHATLLWSDFKFKFESKLKIPRLDGGKSLPFASRRHNANFFLYASPRNGVILLDRWEGRQRHASKSCFSLLCLANKFSLLFFGA
jgi:hypothetical protein